MTTEAKAAAERLEPCPFCESRALTVEGGLAFYVNCNSCDADGPLVNTQNEAIAAWNRRAAPREREAALEEAAKLVEGSVYRTRYRKWMFWPGNQSDDSEIVMFADDAAQALRRLSPKGGGDGPSG